MEYEPYGDLLGYMRTSRGLHDEHYKSEKPRVNDLGSAELMSFAEQIASGMAHLERHNVSKQFPNIKSIKYSTTKALQLLCCGCLIYYRDNSFIVPSFGT